MEKLENQKGFNNDDGSLILEYLRCFTVCQHGETTLFPRESPLTNDLFCGRGATTASKSDR